MSTTKVIQYTTTPASASENARLVQAVFAELATERPEGMSYTALRLDGGESFMHIVTVDTDDNPLARLATFKAFQEGIAERCATGPRATDAAVLGSYPVACDR
jgi:hypothetical protein